MKVSWVFFEKSAIFSFSQTPENKYPIKFLICDRGGYQTHKIV